MTENNIAINQSPQNEPVEPKATEANVEEAQETAKEVQEQFIPQDPSSQKEIASANHDAPEVKRDRIITKYMSIVRKIVVWVLMGWGIYGLFKSIRFIFTELPELEAQLGQNIISQEVVNNFASKAILTAISGIINMAFAIQLARAKNKNVKRIGTIIGFILMIANAWLVSYLNSKQSGILIGEFAFSIFKKLR